MVAVKSCKSSDYSGWNGWQSIVIDTEYGDAWVDKTDENSQSLEMYDAKRRRVNARRKIRSLSKPTSTHVTEDDDIEIQVRSLRSSPWNRRLRTRS